MKKKKVQEFKERKLINKEPNFLIMFNKLSSYDFPLLRQLVSAF